MQPSLVRGRIDPHRCRAAADLGGVGLERVRHRLELAAEVDQQPVAFLGIEELIFFKDVGEGGEVDMRAPYYRGPIVSAVAQLNFLARGCFPCRR